ncbi:MAG: succinylglutamate desuccinylase/aspartoacylase family protein [Oligoflexia bacterium]|nr:succinylglutamate desuccinylase/aspartoacylase family protein [Oligoflexia bacterium]
MHHTFYPPEPALPETLAITPRYHAFGFSSLNQPMGHFTIGSGSGKSILLMSGLHGDEYEGVILLNYVLREILRHTQPIEQVNKTDLLNLLSEWTIFFLPIANPDAFILNQRWNVNLVDLNRNFPASDWQPVPLNPRYPPGKAPASEKETQNIIELISNIKPLMVIDFHSYKESVLLPTFVPNMKDIITVERYIQEWSEQIGIPVGDEVMGYATPGAKQTWCVEQGYPEVTLEIKRGLGSNEIRTKYLHPTIKFIFNFINLYSKQDSEQDSEQDSKQDSKQDSEQDSERPQYLSANRIHDQAKTSTTPTYLP